MKKYKLHITATVILIITLCVSLTAGFASGAAGRFTKQIGAAIFGVKVFIDGGELIPRDVNGKIAEPFIIDGTAYLPARAIAEAFGKYVYWDDDNSSVLIQTPRDVWARPDYRDAPALPSKYVRVSTPQQLADAIAPDTCVTLAAGVYDFTKPVRTKNSYVQTGSKEAALIISGVDGLIIQAEPDAAVDITTAERFSEVLMFSACNGVTLSGINAGHTVNGEYICEAGVALFEQTWNINIIYCKFYGSGSIGVTMRNCASAAIYGTEITDCSLRAVDISDSKDVVFEYCGFKDNRAYGTVIKGYNSTAEFHDCEITGNKNLEWDLVEFDDDVFFRRCIFRDNAHVDGTNCIFSGSGIRLRDCIIEKAGFAGYWEQGIINLGGNMLE